MQVMPNHPYEREHTMTRAESTSARANVKALKAEDKDFLREIDSQDTNTYPVAAVRARTNAGPKVRWSAASARRQPRRTPRLQMALVWNRVDLHVVQLVAMRRYPDPRAGARDSAPALDSRRL